MLKEYDFTNGTRGKYAKAYKNGIKIDKQDKTSKKFFSVLLTQYQILDIIDKKIKII